MRARTTSCHITKDREIFTRNLPKDPTTETVKLGPLPATPDAGKSSAPPQIPLQHSENTVIRILTPSVVREADSVREEHYTLCARWNASAAEQGTSVPSKSRGGNRGNEGVSLR